MIPILFYALVAASCGFALLKGGRSERWAAVVILGGTALTPMVAHVASRRFHGSETGIFLVDTAMLLAFAVIMFASTRFWPIWTTAFQLLTVLAHVWPVIRSSRVAIPFAFDEQFWSWLILAQLLFATRSAIERRRRGARRSRDRSSPRPR